MSIDPYSYLKNKGTRLLLGNGTTTSSLSSTNPGLFERAGATMVEKVNQGLQSTLVQESVSNALQRIYKTLKKFNEKANNPAFRKELENGAKNLSVVLRAYDQPINQALDKIHQEILKIISVLGSGSIKVGTDLMAAVPGLGAFVELGKIANDIMTMIENVIGSGENISKTFNDLTTKGNQNLEQIKTGFQQKSQKQLKNILGYGGTRRRRRRSRHFLGL